MPEGYSFLTRLIECNPKSTDMHTNKIGAAKAMGIFVSIISFCSCQKDTIISTGTTVTTAIAQVISLPATPFNYSNPSLPAYLLTPNINGQMNTPTSNPITDAGATLGRVLFYDKNLSLNKTISCASCHKQENSFADPVAFSAGFANGHTARNAMSLIDAKYYPDGKFFGDERANTLEIQTLGPIQNPVEMGLTLDTLVGRLNALSYYPSLFTKAFGDQYISSDRVSLALAQFVRAIVSYQSKYDVGRQSFAANQPIDKVNFPNFTADENRGKQIFFDPQLSSCAACHGTETFTAPGPKNNGLDLVYTDPGVGGITGITAQNGDFKVPSLRNIELTAPYMHDGRFTTLEQVVEHYSTGIKANANLSQQLKTPNNTPRLLNLSTSDKAALVAFMKTLTDRSVTTDVKYSNPFMK